MINKDLQKSPLNEEDAKKRAAYALNLCLVSISQIIDYDDKIVLDQEYDGILNNLNLEIIPKDEPLLQTLRQILDTITYFRISEGEKAFIDKEYQFKMSNAIWNSVSNLAVLIPGAASRQPDPAAIALSVASAVGIGYMNYRRTKAENTLAYDRQKWELQRAAMEQFHALRRELFTAAWRLADKYNYSDNWRLTENQITQYNRILMDENPYRRYERLQSIEENFEAYPPFWYYKAHAALEVVNSYKFENNADNEECKTYTNYAKSAFEKYFEIMDTCNLLRHDEILSACALEYIELLDDKGKIKELIKKAKKSAGVRYDVWQLCAFSYLKNEDSDEAKELLRNLICEGYNSNLNTNLLSALYIKDGETSKSKYESLQKIIGKPSEIIPWMPKEDLSEDTFVEVNRQALPSMSYHVLNGFIHYYETRFNQICFHPDDQKEKSYALLDEMTDILCATFPGDIFLAFLEKYKKKIKNTEFDNPNTFAYLTKDAFEAFCKKIGEYINGLKKMDEVKKYEASVLRLAQKSSEKFSPDNSSDSETGLIGYNRIEHHHIAVIKSEYFPLKKYIETVKKYEDTLIKKDEKGLSLYRRGTKKFDEYWNAELKGNIKEKSFAMLHDNRKVNLSGDIDLLFMPNYILFFNPHFSSLSPKSLLHLTPLGMLFSKSFSSMPYDAAVRAVESNEKNSNLEYIMKNVDKDKFIDLLKELRSISGKDWVLDVCEKIYENSSAENSTQSN